ncbi:MAG: rRNA maturation RNase YbeY [Lachnospiraceae bacterium]|nr:rRNA maturation RNase YbeY [Lachnospiraceae bacterium]
MALIFEKETEFEADFDAVSVAEAVVAQAADQEGIPYEFDVNLTLVDSEAIRQINREFRGIDEPTDVLSFPNLDFPAPGDFSLLENESREADYFDLESGQLLLGDIVINVDRVFSQAEEFGHSIKREYAFLIAHSMLHLCGYDHMEPGEAAVMEERQNMVLEALHITRDKSSWT